MSGRALLGAFVLGLAAVGAAGAGLNANWSKHLTGAEEVPARTTQAQGQVILHVAPDGRSIDYKLIASNIDNVVQAHIHVGAAGANGPIVAFLYGLVPPAGGRQTGVLSTGTITAANLVGPLAGHPLSDLLDAIESGNAYANVHTSDGNLTPNEGPGDFPGGEIRAQLIE
jgi:CHRD domain